MVKDPFEKLNSMSDNVTSIRPTAKETLRPRAKSILDSVIWSGNVSVQLERNYLVKGWLDRGGVSLIFGPSNTGKTFLALDIVHHIAKGMEWAGRRVRRGRVLYVAAEGGSGFTNRVSALEDPEFFVLPTPFLLTGKDTQAAFLVEVIQHLEAVGGAPFDMVVFDTMARVMGGADENAAPDIADLVRNLGLIQRLTGAHVMLIHHTGKDAGRGARGHSSLRAAVDTEIELTRDEMGVISAEVTKQREGPTGYRFDYLLRQVELGVDQDGDKITTCLVEPVGRDLASKSGLSDSQRRALDVLNKALESDGQKLSQPNYPGGLTVPVEVWRKACLEDGGLSQSPNKETQTRAFRRAREELVSAGLVLVRDENVWVIE